MAFNKKGTLYPLEVNQLIAEVEKAPNGAFKGAEDIHTTAKGLVDNYQRHFFDKNKQTCPISLIRTLFIIMEGKWRELGGQGDFPKPDEPGSYNV